VLHAPVADVERPALGHAVVGTIAGHTAPRAVATHPGHHRGVANPRIRPTTGDGDVDGRLRELLDEVGATKHRDLLFEIMVSAILFAKEPPDRLDLKIVNAALQEMHAAFSVFAPYAEVPKVTIFGSARTHRHDQL